MKKIVIIFILTLFILPQTPIKALDEKELHILNDYTVLLNQLNNEYNTNFHIYNEDNFYKNKYDILLDMSYDTYIDEIFNMNPSDLYNDCLNIIELKTEISFNIMPDLSKSTQATKTIYFNNNINKMTLKYKHTNNTFIQVINQLLQSVK